MKRIISILSLVFAFLILTNESNAQLRYPFSDAHTFSVSVTAAATTVATNIYDHMTVCTFTVDTNTTANFTSLDTELEAGDLFVIKATENTAVADTITWGTGFTGDATECVASKTRIITWVYDGSGFVMVADTQID